MLYHLKFFLALQKLHPVFHVVKLTTVSKDPISKRYSEPILDPIIVDGEEK